jgi:hypothetical protein
MKYLFYLTINLFSTIKNILKTSAQNNLTKNKIKKIYYKSYFLRSIKKKTHIQQF